MAVLLLQHTENYELGIWKLEEPEDELQLLAGKDVMPKHANQVRRMEFLAVRALAVKMGIQATDIAYQSTGKPYLESNARTISISHTKGYVALLVSSHAQAGVDIEHTTDRVQRIRSKFMHPEEEAALANCCNSGQETTGLLLHWCAKEAMFKSIPEEGVDFAQELRVENVATPTATGSFKGRFTRTGSVFHIDYLVQTDFILTCSFSTESK